MTMERLTEKRESPLSMSMWAGSARDLRIYNRLSSIEDILGDNYDIDRLKALVTADKDGRCVVLPCKPSDVTVYEIRDKKHALGVGVHPRHVGCAMVWSGGKYRLCHQGESSLTGENFGKKWHLTQQAAEAALKEMKTHENHP